MTVKQKVGVPTVKSRRIRIWLLYHDLSIALKSSEMYFSSVACQVLLFCIASANPFHKYPYVFLLDVGNEELEKTNTEQIRVSVPGGSLALRYPAIGNGNMIAHVRVSGIDFGTDLKANIVDGGPGSKYLVIVFAGNQGTPYDAVMTIQTVSDEDLNGDEKKIDNTNFMDIIKSNDNTLEDQNNSAEDTDDTETKAASGDKTQAGYSDVELDSQSASNVNVEIQQPSYNKYRYSDKKIYNSENTNEEIRQPSYYAYSSNGGTDDNFNNGDEETSNNNDINKQYSQVNYETQANDELDQEDNQQSQDDDEDIDINTQDFSKSEPQHSNFEHDYGNEDNDKESNVDESNKYTKYLSLMPKLYDGVRIYPQNAVPFVLSDSDNSNDSKDSNEVDLSFNDEPFHNTNSQQDNYSNRQFIDSDGVSAVES